MNANPQLFNPVIPNAQAMYAEMVIRARLGKVCFCTICKKRQTVDPAVCLARGWPMCCGRTMRVEAAR